MNTIRDFISNRLEPSLPKEPHPVNTPQGLDQEERNEKTQSVTNRALQGPDQKESNQNESNRVINSVTQLKEDLEVGMLVYGSLLKEYGYYPSGEKFPDFSFVTQCEISPCMSKLELKFGGDVIIRGSKPCEEQAAFLDELLKKSPPDLDGRVTYMPITRELVCPELCPKGLDEKTCLLNQIGARFASNSLSVTCSSYSLDAASKILKAYTKKGSIL